MQWYYSKNATQHGPVSDGDLAAKLAAGEVSGTDMVWREGMTDWKPVSSVAELAVMLVPAAGRLPVDPYAPPAMPGAMMPGAPPTSGLAIASLVCGIMGLVTCLFLPGIPAVICGHLALNRMADPTARLGGRGMAIAGLITGYVSVIALLGAIAVLFIGIATS